MIIVNLAGDTNEHLTDTKALLNVESLYNNQNLTTTDLTVTGKINLKNANGSIITLYNNGGSLVTDSNFISKCQMSCAGILKICGGDPANSATKKFIFMHDSNHNLYTDGIKAWIGSPSINDLIVTGNANIGGDIKGNTINCTNINASGPKYNKFGGILVTTG